MPEIDLEPKDYRAKDFLLPRQRVARRWFWAWCAIAAVAGFASEAVGPLSYFVLILMAGIGIGISYGRWSTEPLFRQGGRLFLLIYASVVIFGLSLGLVMQPVAEWLRSITWSG